MSTATRADVERYRIIRGLLEHDPIPDRYNIAAATVDRWAADTDRVALIHEVSGNVARLTFADVREASSRLANGLRALGVRRGDRVAIILPQGPEAAVAHVAVYRLGAIAVPLSVMYGPPALAYRLADAGASVGIVSSEELERVAGLTEEVTWLVVGGSRTLPCGAHRFEDVIAAGNPNHQPADTAANDPAMLIYTSGTTGMPKGVLHAHRVVPAHAAPISLAHDFFPRPEDVLWSPADWAWAGGLIDCLLAAWQVGRPIAVARARRFEPDEALATLQRHRVTNTFLPPTALRIMREASPSGYELALRSIMTGGEPSGADLLTWYEEEFGLVPNEVYGQTEVSCVLGNSSAILPVRPGSIGVEYPGSRVAVLSPDGEPLPAGEVGELAVHRSTPAMFLGYWNDPEATREKFAGDWALTGDLGRCDADGYYWFSSRKDDLIISAGYRIGPAEVEACLSRHISVAAAAVVGIPDELRGNVVKAYVELRAGWAPSDEVAEELRAFVRRELAAYQVPRVVEFLEELPRTVTGKVQHALLRERAGTPATT